MEHTQNGLSMDKAKLDYQAMVTTAQVAFAKTRNELERFLHQTHEYSKAGQLKANYSLTAHWIKQEADNLVIVAETMDTLNGGLSRHRIKVVNKPKIKEF